MKTLIPIVTEELESGRCVALATVLQSKGSAPRGAGAVQLLLLSGRALGTVGGGVLERRALDELQALLTLAGNPSFSDAPPASAPSVSAESILLPAGSPSHTQEYALTQNEVQSLGMVCGGNVSLLYQALTPDMLPFFRALQARLTSGQNLWLVRVLAGGSVVLMGMTDGETNAFPLPDSLLFPLCGRRAAWVTGISDAIPSGMDSVFVEPVVLVSHTYVFGGGHVAQCVVPLLAKLDFAPVVYDDRPEFSSRALFSTAAEVVCAPFSEASERLRITAEDEIVIMTRGHANDLAILSQALRTEAYYIGLIGSRSKIAYTKNLLEKEGFSAADFTRVHTPVGLPIKAETPMEIAVSVAAEMILCRAEYAERDSAPKQP